MSPSSLPTPAPGEHSGALFLRRLLLALALLTVAAMAEKFVGLSAPMPTAEAPSALNLKGYRVSVLAAGESRRGRELSHGILRRFRLASLSGEPPLTLTLLPVRSRTGTERTLAAEDVKGLKMEQVVAMVPSFALKEQRIVSMPLAKPQGTATKADELALGRGSADPAGSTTRLQTCLTPSGVAGVSVDTLAVANQIPAKPGDPPPRLRRLLQLAGLTQARHECLAVQLERERPGAGSAGRRGSVDGRGQLQAGWKDLRKVLVQAQ